MKNIITYNRFILLILLFVCILLLVATFGQWHSFWILGTPKEISGSYLALKFGFSILMAPLIETLIFQHWLLLLLKNNLSFYSEEKKWLWAVLLSSLIFALAHTLTPLHLLTAFCIGVVLGATYWIFTLRKDFNPILAVWLLHFGNNLLWFVIVDLAPWRA